MTALRFTVHHGDSLAILSRLPASSVDAIITDPPYSSGGMFRGDRAKGSSKYNRERDDNETTARADFMGDSRDQRAFGYWCSLWLGECFRCAKDGSLLALFCDWRQLPMMTDVVQSGGWVWRGIVPWNKTDAARPQKGWFRAQCEYIIVAAKGKPVLYGEPDAPALVGSYTCAVDRGGVHQTQKPVALMRWLLQVTPPGSLVLDPFTGSGTTGVAAILEGRRFIGCELSEHYASIARRRCEIAAADGVERSLFDESAIRAASAETEIAP